MLTAAKKVLKGSCWFKKVVEDSRMFYKATEEKCLSVSQELLSLTSAQLMINFKKFHHMEPLGGGGLVFSIFSQERLQNGENSKNVACMFLHAVHACGHMNCPKHV